jgi:hypothetical protein
MDRHLEQTETVMAMASRTTVLCGWLWDLVNATSGILQMVEHGMMQAEQCLEAGVLALRTIVVDGLQLARIRVATTSYIPLMVSTGRLDRNLVQSDMA